MSLEAVGGNARRRRADPVQTVRALKDGGPIAEGGAIAISAPGNYVRKVAHPQ